MLEEIWERSELPSVNASSLEIDIFGIARAMKGILLPFTVTAPFTNRLFPLQPTQS